MINTKPTFETKVYQCNVNKINYLTDHAFEIEFNDKPFDFTSGQHVILSMLDDLYDREYSIASSENENKLKLLVKEVEDGYLTPKLKKIKTNDIVNIRGPHGRFCIDLINHINKNIILIATGTGIAPFRSMVKSYSNLNFSVIHGVKKENELYYKNDFKCDYTSCISQENKGNFQKSYRIYKNKEFDSESIFLSVEILI